MKSASLRHVVLFGFQDGASANDIGAVVSAFALLREKIACVKGFEWGVNVSPENIAQGYTHCFMLTFASETDRDSYLTHPAHLEFGTLLKGILKQVLVVDYWTD